MHFSLKKIIMGAACLFMSVARADDCESGPWQDLLSVGGQGGERWCATKWSQGVVVTGLEVWSTSGSVQALQFYYSDGTNSDLFGKINGDRHDRIDWDPSVDSVSQLKTWGNGNGKYLGRVQLRTKSGKELDVGKDTSGQDTFEIKTGSGILLGAYGNAGDNINHAGFLFLKGKVDKVSIDDVVFKETPEELNKRMQGLEMVTLHYADHTNHHPEANETFVFGKTETRTTSKKYTNSGAHAFGWSTATALKGTILDLGVTSTTTLSYQYTKTKTDESTKESSVTLSYSVSTALKPGQRVFCRATAMTGQYKGEYSSTVNVWLNDGTTFGFSQGGTMEQVNWSKASSVCQDREFDPVAKRAMKFIA